MAYIGFDDKARKVKSVYVGVNNVARKVTTGYVGVNDVARKWWGTQETTDPDVPVNPPIDTKTHSLDNSWYRTSYPKENITKIGFVLGYMTHPLEGSYSEKWNADSGNTGGVIAYRTGTEIRIMMEPNLTVYSYSFLSNCSGMFANFTNLETLIFGEVWTNNVTDMSNMFYNCSNLSMLELGDFNTRNVTNMREMFSGCSSLLRIEVTGPYTPGTTTYGWVTANADTTDMFKNCGCSSVTYV